MTDTILLNREPAQIMHLDLNSAFATIEQQAHPSLRGKPIGVTNRISRHCCIIAASYEAKRLGVKVGMNLEQARQIIPEFIILETDPPKYHYVYQKLMSIMKSYSPTIKMKSIDEGIIDFHGTLNSIYHQSLETIGQQIKQQLKEEVGEWMKLNIGIGPNQFLAKVAASLHKPDGMDRIDHKNLIKIYRTLKLTDLTGIASHYEARLNAIGIYTPIDFLKTSADTLNRRVFHSIIGESWYQRLRGFEVDNFNTNLNHIGRQWTLNQPTNKDSLLLPSFQFLCQTTGKKLRFKNLDARGIMIWLQFNNGESWYQRKMYKTNFFSDHDIYQKALYLFNQRPKNMTVMTMGITCYQLTKSSRNQISLLEQVNRDYWLTTAIDSINEKYGNFKIFSANSLDGTKLIKQKIPFGGTEYFDLLLQEK